MIFFDFDKVDSPVVFLLTERNISASDKELGFSYKIFETSSKIALYFLVTNIF